MKKLYAKSELWFSLLWIIVYVVLFSLADSISVGLEIEKIITAPLCILMTVILLLWIKRNNLLSKYGLAKIKVEHKKYLYYLPLLVLISTNLWGGIALHLSPVETVLYVVSMIGVGILEEVIFRGLLFRAMEKDNLKTAIILSSLTFGIGHIVNLFNGSGRDPASSVIQVVFAVLVGFVLVLIFYNGKSLVPCIIFHSVNNALKVFEADGSFSPRIEMVMNLVVIFVVLGGYVFYLVKAFSGKAE